MAHNERRIIVYIVLLILIVTVLVIAFCVGILISHLRIVPEPSQPLPEAFYYASRIPYIPITYVLGILVSEQLYDIIECESGFDPDVCNVEYGCGSGQGLAQIIPSTLRHCEEKLEKELDVFDPQDNIACAQYLLEEEGDYHWGTATSSWGSYDCWSAL